MHKIKHVWEKITDLENIKTAIVCASAKKLHRKSVQRVLMDVDLHAREIQHMLLSKTYKPSPYIPMTVQDGSAQKTRLIHKPQFYPDQCIHWALSLPLQETWGKSIYPYSCGSIPGRGLHMGARAMKRWLANDPKGTKYCYKFDIRKYYPSVNLDRLMNQFTRKIHDPDALWLIGQIVYSHDQGLPIGNFTSQWFANLYLSDFDWWVRQNYGMRYYQRYIDDVVILHNNKRTLHKMRNQIERVLSAHYGLKIKPTWQVFRVDSRGVDFLGYRFYHNKTIIRKTTAYRIAKRVRKVSRKPEATMTDASAVMSYMGVTKHCDSYNFLNRYVIPFVSLRMLKEIHRENCKIISSARAV